MKASINFFRFDALDGNFCHAAVGVPKENYDSLEKLLQPTWSAYKRQVARLRGAPPDEVKYAILRTLPMRFRLAFAKAVARSLAETGGFVSGFYTTTRGLIMERVRTNLLDEAASVPAEHANLYEVARQELLEQFRGIGQANLIKTLLLTPAASIVSFLRSFDCVFQLRWDPRQEAEDQEVRTDIEDYLKRLKRVPDLFSSEDVCLGIEFNLRSEDDLGLQLADVIVGEVREFFRYNQEILEEGATLELITVDSDEPLQHFERLDGRLFKAGVLSPMSASLRRKVIQKNSANIMSYYYPLLAAGMLTSITSTGQPRHLEFPTSMFFDQLD